MGPSIWMEVDDTASSREEYIVIYTHWIANSDTKCINEHCTWAQLCFCKPAMRRGKPRVLS